MSGSAGKQNQFFLAAAFLQLYSLSQLLLLFVQIQFLDLLLLLQCPLRLLHQFPHVSTLTLSVSSQLILYFAAASLTHGRMRACLDEAESGGVCE